MAPGGEMFRYPQHFGENVLPHGSHEWLPYSKNEVRLKSSNNNLSPGFTPFPVLRLEDGFFYGRRGFDALCRGRRVYWLQLSDTTI